MVQAARSDVFESHVPGDDFDDVDDVNDVDDVDDVMRATIEVHRYFSKVRQFWKSLTSPKTIFGEQSRLLPEKKHVMT